MIIKQILRTGRVNVHRLTSQHRSYMYIAAEKGLRRVVQHLAAKCLINVNARTTTEPKCGYPLHVAILYGRVGVVDELLNELQADANVLDPTTGYSPLFSAVCLGQEAMVGMLINSGADANIASKQGRMPLFAACEKGDTMI